MSKRKSKYKGVRYIAQTITRYFDKKYPTYKSALPKAREIKSQLDSLKQPVKVKSIKAFIRVGRTGRKAGPQIDSKLLQVSYYFELVDYPVYILRSSKEIFFTSKIVPKGLSEIQGGTTPDYDTYFAPFVNYINSMTDFVDPEEKRYETEWNVQCSLPVYNKAKKRWESEIMCLDSQGNQFEYDFNPKKPDDKAKKFALNEEIQKGPAKMRKKKETPVKPEKSAKIEKPSEERVKEIRGLIADLRQDVKDGLIDKQTYQKSIKDLLDKLENGGEV